MKAKTRPYKNGEPRKAVAFRFPPKAIDKLRAMAERKQQSQSDVLVELIRKAR